LIKEIFSEYYDHEQIFVLESKKNKNELVKELVELNGGLLSVESKLGHGTTFYIKCPVKDV
jgi:light-regulated signal transduction histidine kinase (bacteriophytochrome)